MSVLPSDIVVYGSAYMPETYGTPIGGAIDFSRRVAFYDITPTGNVDVISSSAGEKPGSGPIRRVAWRRPTIRSARPPEAPSRFRTTASGERSKP